MLFQKSFSAGFLIGIVSYMYLVIQNQMLGAFLFSIGLLTICLAELKLYTGAVGFQFNKQLVYILIWNLFGVLFASLLCVLMNPNLSSIAYELTLKKMDSNYLQILIKGFFCGVCMFYAVYLWKNKKSILGIICFIALFILAGFEHSIADLFYFTCSNIISIELTIKWILILIGNTLGARFCSEMQRC